jgi:hypothetical protein
LPVHLRAEKPLARYWEDLGLKVESVTVGRKLGTLARLLEERTSKLLALEAAWTQYVGNPVLPEALKNGYNRDEFTREIIHDDDGRQEGAERGYTVRASEDDGNRNNGISPEQSPATPSVPLMSDHDIEAAGDTSVHTFTVPGKRRQKKSLSAFSKEQVDMLDHLARQYRVADEAVRQRRKGRFKAANIAFVTFQDIGSAQIAAQVVHYPQADSLITMLAPDPRDIHWGNMLLSDASLQARGLLVLGAMILLLTFWLAPVSALARLLDYDSIKKYLPWLIKPIEKRWVKSFNSTTIFQC